MSEAHVKISELDTRRWGVPTAKASGVTAATLPAVLDESRAANVKFLIARCPASDLAAVHGMEQAGFLLMDTLVYYSRSATGTLPEDTGSIPVRPIRDGEADAVRSIAAHAFQNYGGHYHSDPRLDRASCDAVYTDWAHRSAVSRDVADEVMVGDLNGEVVAFATLELNSEEEGEGVLFGVSPKAQGRGIYRSLMVQGLHFCASRKRARMVVSTQVTNVAVQKVWVRLGFEPSKAYYTFHKWF